jgi:hypothetical protein
MKYLVAYNTLDGSILDMKIKSKESFVVCEGTGIMDAGVVTGSNLAGVDESKIVQFFVESDFSSRRHGYSRFTRISPNAIDTGHASYHPTPIQVRFKGIGLQPATPFTPEERDAFKAAVIASVGHSNVGVIKIKTDRQIGAETHEVNLATGKIQRADRIEYES